MKKREFIKKMGLVGLSPIILKNKSYSPYQKKTSHSSY
jgi:hypothetical protein